MNTAPRTAALLAAVLSTLSLVACDDPGESPFAAGVEVDEPGQLLTFTAPTDPSAIPPDGLPDPEEPMPDLIIDGTAQRTVGIVGYYWRAQFRVKNRGTLTAPASKAGVLLLDDWNNPDPAGVHVGDVPALAPGAGAWVSVYFAAAGEDIPGYTDIGWDIYGIIDYKTRFLADHTKLVGESNETNNALTVAW